jgi:hypothetical protein
MPLKLQTLFLMFEYIKIKFYSPSCGNIVLLGNNGIVSVPGQMNFQLVGGVKMVSRS